ncbi:SGNH/GDSL hydrolase family protein, partial [Klebsiella sp. DR_160cip]
MAFNPELGSSSPAVLLDNAERLDKLVNGPAADVPDRGGDPLYSWRQMMAKNDEIRQNIIPLNKQYATLAAAQADIANISVGSTTYYRSPDNSALAIEVMNVGGTLQPTGRRMVSQKTVEGIIPSLVGPGMNLFNKGAVISGFYLFEGTGIPRENPEYCYSEKISAVAGGAYTSRLLTRVVTFFDGNDNYLSDLS